MEAYFATMSEDVRHERLSVLLLSLAEADVLKERRFTDHEIKIKKFCSR